MTNQANILPNTLRELTSSDLDNVGGGASGTVLGPKLTGVVDAVGALADDVTGGAAAGLNGIIDSLKP